MLKFWTGKGKVCILSKFSQIFSQEQQETQGVRGLPGPQAKQMERVLNFQRNVNRLRGAKEGGKGHYVPVWSIIIGGIFANVL